jgi:hypothetical protein
MNNEMNINEMNQQLSSEAAARKQFTIERERQIAKLAFLKYASDFSNDKTIELLDISIGRTFDGGWRLVKVWFDIDASEAVQRYICVNIAQNKVMILTPNLFVNLNSVNNVFKIGNNLYASRTGHDMTVSELENN